MRQLLVVFPLFLLLLISSFSSVDAIWIDDGNPICVAPGGQTYPKLFPDGEGGALIVWRDLRDPEFKYYAQRIDKDGNTLLQEDGVPIPTNGDYWTDWATRPDGYGGAIIAYQGTDYISGQGIIRYIRAARLSKNGTMVWPDSGVTLCSGPGYRWRPSVASDGAGGAIVGWDQKEDFEADWNIFVQRVSASGTVMWQENGIPVCTAPEGQYYVRVTSDGTGGAFITWQDSRDDDHHVYVQHVDADGNLLWDPNGRPITAPSPNGRQAVALSDGRGGAYVNWVENKGTDRHLYSQRIDSDGNPLWALEGVPICEAPGNRCTCWNYVDRVGGVIITWRDQRSDEWDIYAQRIDDGGNALWTPDGVPVCVADGRQYELVAVADGEGGTYVVWQDGRLGDDNYDIYAQWIDKYGNPRWMENGIALCDNDSTQIAPAVTTDAAGGAYVAWVDYRYRTTDPQERDLFATRIIAEEVVIAFLDIKPGSCPNPFNPKSRGVTPVALLGSGEFDVSSVDPSTILLEGVPPLRWSMEDVGTPVRPKDECDCADADGDGYMDLTLKFETQDLVEAMGALTVGSDMVLTMTGELEDGTLFEAHDCVVIKGGKKYQEWLERKRGLAGESNPAEIVQLLSYELPERSLVEVSVYDVSGRLVERLQREVRGAGLNTIEWNTAGVQSGIYFVKMTAGTWSSTLKVPLVR